MNPTTQREHDYSDTITLRVILEATRQNLNARQLAALTGISHRRMTRIYNGHPLYVEEVARLAQALRLDLAALVTA